MDSFILLGCYATYNSEPIRKFEEYLQNVDV